MPSVHDVAAYVVDHFDQPISTMKLQKLVYFAQGWALGATRTQLFPQRFQAWVHGPVSYDLFRQHRGDYAVSRWPAGNKDNLSHRDRVIVDAVLRNYGALGGPELREISHKPQSPWTSARTRAGVAENESSQEFLSEDEMMEYFGKLLSPDSDGQHR